MPTTTPLRLTGGSTNAAKDAADVSRDIIIQGTLATTTTVLLTMAAGTATVPVVGWVTAGIAAILAGLTTLVERVLTAKIKRAEAVQWATTLGIAHPEDFPGWLVTVAHESFAARWRRATNMTRELAAERNPAKRKELEQKRAVVTILLVREWLEANPMAGRPPIPPQAPHVVLTAAYSSSPWTPVLLGGMLALTAAVLVLG